ncbi:hypothetical protein [Dyella tabacisoli]|uniref:hypothetical protein n=1 Tax=Dyella tabacisoli TaxID=2282381 RepID=UPI0013B3C591|nr:hypothetical protein [Dyella tabacisoli]
MRKRHKQATKKLRILYAIDPIAYSILYVAAAKIHSASAAGVRLADVQKACSREAATLGERAATLC